MTGTEKSKSAFDSFQKCRKKIYKEAQKQKVIHTKNYTRQFRALTKHTNTMLNDRTEHDRRMFRQLHDVEYHLNADLESAESPPSDTSFSDLDDSIEKTKRTKIEHYFHAHNDICEIQNEQRSFNNVSGITLVPPDELLQDAPSNLSDLEKDVENSYLQELSVETLNPTIERLIRLKEGIARYRITFLPEFHLNDPVKRLFTDKEWIIMQSKWRKIEEEIVNTSNHF
ncbi:unnamed protein product [Rhizophagus irregularis]|nr:unnamed protein product [Rhizophagus irregularis]